MLRRMRPRATGSPRRLPARGPGSLLLIAALAAGCSAGSSDGPPRADATALPFTGCDQVACSGTLRGAHYEIRLPTTWNGTLLLYSHGYRSAQPAPPAFDPVETTPQVAATDEVAARLLAQGYALAGSAYRTNGWAVADGVAAGQELYDFFASRVGLPARTYVWGDSLGGLITETLAERHPAWLTGAAPMCGVLAGANLNLDLALDITYAVRTLIDPQLRLVNYRSYNEAVKAFQHAYDRIMAATRDVSSGIPKLLLIAALVDAPTQTENFDGSTARSMVSAVVEALVTGLEYGTVGRQEIEQRVGGNPSGNVGVNYATRISAAERTAIEAVSPGSVQPGLAALAAGRRVAPQPAARTALGRLGNPTGSVRVPTITLHTRADPLVVVQNETVFAHRVATAPGRTNDVVQLYTAPPPTYSPPAPYGAGHCNFTTGERVGVIGLLDRWVRSGVYPTGAVVAAAFGTDKGLATGYLPGPWPAGTDG